METRVQKWGNSLALRIPKPFAAEVLGEIGADAADAVPALRAALRAEYRSHLIRQAIGVALKRIDANVAAEEGVA